MSNLPSQRIIDNKEASIALARHASQITIRLFLTLKWLHDLDSMQSNIEQFVECVLCYGARSKLNPQRQDSEEHRRVLEEKIGKVYLSRDTREAT
jgi:hypothetical protein